MTYGSFYFCRANLPVALPGIQEEFKFTKVELGQILMALKLAYGAGQFINGQLAECISPRKLFAIGLLASAGLNVAFGFATSLYFMTFLWACNGYVQSLGWPPTMRVAANWFDTRHHGRAIGFIGTGYQLCNALTFFLSGWAASMFGWRGVFYVPSALLVISAVHMWCVMEERPKDSAAPGAARPATNGRGVWQNILVTLTNPALWLVGISLCLLDACRFGFVDWGVTHLKEVQSTTVSSAAFKYAVLPLGGIIGSLASGWVTDRWFAGRRVPTLVVMLTALGVFTFVYDTVIHWGMIASVISLFLVGFCIFGAQLLLVGTLPVDLARSGTAAAAAGFVNFMGYMGAAAGDMLTGQIAHTHGWTFAVRFWGGCAILSGIAVACIWKRERRLRENKTATA